MPEEATGRQRGPFDQDHVDEILADAVANGERYVSDVDEYVMVALDPGSRG